MVQNGYFLKEILRIPFLHAKGTHLKEERSSGVRALDKKLE